MSSNDTAPAAGVHALAWQRAYRRIGSLRILGVAALLAAAACGGSTSADDDDDAAVTPDDGRVDVVEDAASDAGDGHEDRSPPVDGFAEGDGDTAGEAGGDDGGGPDGTADAGSCRPWLGGPCDIVVQCGCGPGERCVLDYSGGGRPIEMCVAAGTDPFGAPCEGGVDNCIAGSQCQNEGGGDVCMPYCRSDRDCPGGWNCFCGVSGLTPDDEYRGCCNAAEPCDPFTAEGCAPDEACVLFGPWTDCYRAGTARPGESCEGGADCVVGSACTLIGPTLDSICVQYCRLDGGRPDCAELPGTLCTAGLGVPDVGRCLAPPG